MAVVADTPPRSVRAACRGGDGPPCPTRGGGRAVGGASSRAPVQRDGRGHRHDVPPIVGWEWACSSPPYLGEKDPHFHHQDARTERRVREASGILVRAS